MIYNDEQIQKISTEDYFYLTENFEFIDSKMSENCVRYLVYNKRKKLFDTVRQVMNNELTEKEKNLALDYWCNKISVDEIVKKHQISRSAFYRAIDVIRNKLDVSLKYVLFYNDAVKPPSTQALLTQIKTGIYAEEEFEN